jgi:CopG family nickel-responsive transcriptional regulator
MLIQVLGYILDSMVVISVSISSSELKDFDAISKELGFSSRSDAVRSALSRFISANRLILGSRGEGHYFISVSYKERKKHLVTEVIHKYSDVIRSSLHTHFDEKCVEQIIITGEYDKVKSLTEELSALKDVRYCICVL